MPRPSFLNAGDGRHEHPTQEALDQFSFLEQLNWDRSEIHLALVGDLANGRTVHSKADGLQVFARVVVDLVAPQELRMPEVYVKKMKDAGMIVREFASIHEYLEQAEAEGRTAKIWYSRWTSKDRNLAFEIFLDCGQGETGRTCASVLAFLSEPAFSASLSVVGWKP